MVCRCKLQILGICLASVCSALQVAIIYLDKYQDTFDKTWFSVISLILNCGLAGIHSFQIGLKGECSTQNSEGKNVAYNPNGDDVETAVIPIPHQNPHSDFQTEFGKSQISQGSITLEVSE